MIVCSNCGRMFKDDCDLSKILITSYDWENGPEEGCLYYGESIDDSCQLVTDGCPECLTDAYLMEVEQG